MERITLKRCRDWRGDKREKVNHIKQGQCHCKKEIVNSESMFAIIYLLHLPNVIQIDYFRILIFRWALFYIQDSSDVFSVISRKKEIKETFDFKVSRDNGKKSISNTTNVFLLTPVNSTE